MKVILFSRFDCELSEHYLSCCFIVVVVLVPVVVVRYRAGLHDN